MTIAFVHNLAPAHRVQAIAKAPILAALLDEVVARGRSAWPDIDQSLATFAPFLAERLDGSLPLIEALSSARAADLWIACACGAGDDKAIRAFERAYFQEITVAMRRSRSLHVCKEDVAQAVRERLFVARVNTPPKILDYRGQGSIRSWLRITAARIVLNLATRGPREQLAEDDWFARVVASEESSELSHMKTTYRGEFRIALESAVAALDPKDRNILRYSFKDGLSIDEIGGIYGVHRATAARWITRAQQHLVERTREALMQRLGAMPHEVDSIVQLIASRFGVSLAGLLHDDPDKLAK